MIYPSHMQQLDPMVDETRFIVKLDAMRGGALQVEGVIMVFEDLQPNRLLERNQADQGVV